MNYLNEIVRELCWNPEMDDLFNYLVADRSLDIDEEDVYKVKSVIGDFIDSAYFPNPYENDSINMTEFVDNLEVMVWRKFNTELNAL